MVKPTDINPDQFARSSRRGAASVPRLTGSQLSSVRNVPSVTPTGDTATVNAMLSMADDSRRLAATTGDMFDQQLSAIQAVQGLEAEKVLADAMLKADQAVELAKAETDNTDDLSQAIVDAHKKATDSVMGKATLSAYQQEYLMPKLQNVDTQVAANALNYQQQVRIEDAKLALDEAEQARLHLVNKNPMQLANLKSEIDSFYDQLAPVIPAVELRKRKEGFEESLTVAALQGEIQANPALAKQRLESGMFDADLPVHKKSVLVRDADTQLKRLESEAKRAQAEKQNALVSGLERSIFFGEGEQVPTASKLQELYEAGSISSSQQIALQTKLDKRFKEQNEANAEYQIGAAIVSSGMAVDTTNKQFVDSYNTYYEQRERFLEDMPVAERNAQRAEMVKNARILPKKMKADIKSASRSSDPEVVMEAANLVRTIDNHSPYVLGDLASSPETRRLFMLNDRIMAGYEPSEAIRLVDQKLVPNNEEQNKTILGDFKEQTKNMDFRKRAIDVVDTFLTDTQDVLSKVVPFMGAGLETSAPAVQPLIAKMGAEYSMALQDSYLVNTDMSIAEEEAARIIRGKYGISSINGQAELAEYPVENYYNIPGDEDMEWMQKQLISYAKTKTGKPVSELRGRVRLVADPIVTPNTANVGRPQYNVVYQRDDGTFQQLNTEGYIMPDRMKRIEQLFKEDATRWEGLKFMFGIEE